VSGPVEFRVPSEPAVENPVPFSLDAERAVLGAILLDNRALEIAKQKLQPADFFNDSHRKIFVQMLALGEAGTPIDDVTLTDRLRCKNELDSVGGPAFVSQLADGMPRVSNLEHYAKIVKEKSLLRQLAHAGDFLKRGALGGKEDAGALVDQAKAWIDGLRVNGHEIEWRSMFHSFEEFESAPPLRMAIKGIIQLDAATAIGALAGDGKTWTQMSIAGAMLRGPGTKLWELFDVLETIPRILYLIPESTLGPFAHRARKLGLLPFVKNDRFLVRTLSKGPRPSLSDPRILAAAKGSFVMLDTLVRFGEGNDEDSAGEFQALADAILALMGAGAIGVSAAHHAPKSFAGANVMTLEGVLRGTGDIGAIFATVFGMKQLDAEKNIIHVENVKARDFEPTKPFQLIGRPYIDELGDFEPYKRPGECGALHDEQEPQHDKGGARQADRQKRAANLELLRTWLKEDPRLSSEQIAQRYKNAGISIEPSTVRHYRSELQKQEREI
jgi:DnaB-like helicase N terminal domain/AAA domain